MNRSDLHRLRDAREHVGQAIARLVAVDKERLAVENDLFHAFLFNVVVIGTTLGKIPKAVQALGSDVPWRDVIDTRNRIVHAYWQVEYGLLSSVTVERLERLREGLDRLIIVLERDAS